MGSDVTEISTPKLLPCDDLEGETVKKIGCGESHIAIVTGKKIIIQTLIRLYAYIRIGI